MDEQRNEQTAGKRNWGWFFVGIAGGALLGIAVGEPGPLALLGAMVGLVATLSVRKPSVPRYLAEVAAFVRGAYREGDIDTEAYERLAERLRTQGFWMAPASLVVPDDEAPASVVASTAVVTAPAPAPAASPAAVSAPPRPPSKPPTERPVAGSRPSTPSPTRPPATPSRPPSPPTPAPDRQPAPQPTPRRVPTFFVTILGPIRRFWQALAGDFAVQGLGSLGVLLVFTATLGFVFFAFTSVGVAYRPVAEVLVPVVLFGMAAFLRRRKAAFMAAAVEFLGGAVTPVMVFAAIVDGSAFLPTLERGSLVAALASAALVMAAGYAWIVHRRPASPLRFLVAPLVWSAVGVVGLAFHEGASAAQMALVVVVVAVTAWVVKLRPGGALAGATRLMAPFGLVAAYALMLVFSLAEGWPVGPMVASGIASIAAIEAMRSMVARSWVVEAAVVVATAAAAAVTVDPPWVGVAATAVFLALAERWAIAADPDTELAVRVLGGAALAGAFVAIWQPEPLIAVSGLLTVWANVRRFRPLPGLELATGLVAAFAPVGTVVGLALLIDVPTALLAGGVAVLAVSLGVRLTAPADVFCQVWVVAAAVLVALGAAAGWPVVAGDYRLGVAVAMAALAAVLPRIRIDARLWAGAALAYWGWILLAEAAQLSGDTRTMIVAAIGLGAVLTGVFVPERTGGHVAAVGHLVALSAFAYAPQSWWLVGALAGWVAGWTVEVVTEDRSPLQRLGGEEMSATDVGWVQAVVLAASVPVLAAFAALEIWPNAVVTVLTWTAALVGVGYAGFAGWVAIRPRLGEVAALGSIVLTAAAVGLAFAEFDVSVASDRVVQMGALASGIVAVGLVGGRRRLWMQWYAWFLSLQLTVVAAMALGLAEADVYWALIGWGAVALIGSLAVDEIRSGLRPLRTVVRDARLWPPFVLGSVSAVAGIATGLAVPIESAWPVAVAGLGISAIVALQLRLGILSAPGWGLAAYATVSGLVAAGYDLAVDPWLLVGPTLVLLAAAVILLNRGDPVIRWDLPPLVVGLLLAAATVGLGYEAASTATTWLPIGAGLAIVAVLKRWWVLAPFGFVLVLGAASFAGHGWFSAALAATMVATGVAARMTKAETAAALQWLSAGFGVAAWVELTLALGLSQSETLTASALASAVVALLAAGVSWARPNVRQLMVWTVPWVAVAWVGYASVALGAFSTGAPSAVTATVAGAAWVWAIAAVVSAIRLDTPELGALAVGQAFVAIGLTGWSLDLDTVGWVTWLTSVAAVSTATMMAVSVRASSSRWVPALATVAGGTLLGAGAAAATMWPERQSLIVVLIAATGFTLAAGVASRDRRWFYLAPGLAFAAWAAFASEATTGNVQWFSTPLALALLVEVELARHDRRRRHVEATREELVLVELMAMALFVGPALVQAVTVSTAYGLLAIAQGVVLAIWGTATRVRRRALGGFLAAAVAALLMIAVPLAELIPQFRGPALWATIFGIGAILIVIASTIEQTRRRFAEIRTSLESMMEGWE
jgi:hypothetical protein